MVRIAPPSLEDHGVERGANFQRPDGWTDGRADAKWVRDHLRVLMSSVPEIDRTKLSPLRFS